MSLKFLADMGISKTVVTTLKERGIDAVHIRECLPVNSPDEAILQLAASEDRVVLTMDHDFGDL